MVNSLPSILELESPFPYLMVPSLALELQNISALHIKYHVRQSLLRLEQLQKSKQKERLSEAGTIRQRFGEIEANPISLPEEYCNNKQ